MKASILIFVTLGVASFSQAFLARHESDCARRGTSGLICSDDCNSMALCIKEENSWTRVEVESCSGDKKCNIFKNECSSEPGPCKSPGQMYCTKEGTFPDPYDCQRYYFCTEKGAQGILKECGGDKAFNIADGSCTAKVGELGACKKIEADCETQTAGFSAPFTQNKKFYYICKAKTENDKRILFPEVYKCEDGLEYTAEEGCKKN
ncbi:uncharacterized protein LOC113385243 [Ctenocephalides felis]|uniref:uncharacterized protein LOC113385243 n=1 Tax=Ctenocephalides felis TaxID=7515 RepID=UPI000E6E1B40|nr:uncharacterized protein LOC113385243 [Ctenocephalides felis]